MSTNYLFKIENLEKESGENWRETEEAGQKIEKIFWKTNVADGTRVGWTSKDGENRRFLIKFTNEKISFNEIFYLICKTYVTNGDSQMNSSHLFGCDAGDECSTKEDANEEHVGSHLLRPDFCPNVEQSAQLHDLK